MKPARAAFTLVELLVTLAVLGVLAALALSAMWLVRGSGDRAKAIANMRAIGSAIPMYVADHGGFLPGPLWPGQVPELDPSRDGRLVRELAPYLGIEIPPQPALIDLFVPPAYRKAMPRDALATSRTYVVNMAINSGSDILNPWGSLAAGDSSSPRPLAVVPARAWGFSDADRLHPRVAGAPWAANTPEVPVHGKRLAWFFDGSVSAVETAELE